METQLVNRYAANLHGVLSCYDRIVITGTIPGACYAQGMTSFLYSQGVRIFDYAQFAEPLRDRVRSRAQEVCAAAGLEIEHVSKSHIRKEELVQRVLASRGEMPPDWCMFCRPCRPARATDPGTTRSAARPTSGVTRASACTTTFTSSTRNWACDLCESCALIRCQPGRFWLLGRT